MFSIALPPETQGAAKSGWTIEISLFAPVHWAYVPPETGDCTATVERYPGMSRSRALIYDFGMDTGEDTEYYLRKGFDVVAVEANPASCELVAERLRAHLDSGSLTILNRAIGDSAGKLPFFVCNEMSARSTASRELVALWSNEGETFHEVEVEFCAADGIAAEYGPAYYVKIDIEGHDIICLRQLLTGGGGPEYLSFEVDFGTYREALSICARA